MSSLNICGRRNRRVEGGVTPWLHLSPHHHPLLHISQLIPGQIFKTTSLFILLLLYLCCLCCTWTVSWACAALMHVRLQELCDATGCVCLQEPVLHLCLSVYMQELCAALLHLDVSAYRSPANAVPVGVQSTRYMFETTKQIVTNQKKIFFVSWNNRNRLSFGSFRFKLKIIFLFVSITLYSQPSSHHYPEM